jgi:hypothetical protein
MHDASTKLSPSVTEGWMVECVVSLSAAVAEKEETSAKIIDGKAIAADIRAELKEKVTKLQEQYGKVPRMGTIHVCLSQIEIGANH